MSHQTQRSNDLKRRCLVTLVVAVAVEVGWLILPDRYMQNGRFAWDWDLLWDLHLLWSIGFLVILYLVSWRLLTAKELKGAKASVFILVFFGGFLAYVPPDTIPFIEHGYIGIYRYSWDKEYLWAVKGPAGIQSRLDSLEKITMESFSDGEINAGYGAQEFVFWQTGVAHGYDPELLFLKDLRYHKSFTQSLVFFLTIGPIALFETIGRAILVTFPTFLIVALMFPSLCFPFPRQE